MSENRRTARYNSYRNSPNCRRRRRLIVEQLEARRVLASVWQNPFDIYDVNDDGLRTPLDVLNGINDINSNGIRQLPPTTEGSGPSILRVDTNGDGKHTPQDILDLINYHNSAKASPVFTGSADRQPLTDARTDPNDAASSVFLHNGAVTLERTDLAIPGRGMDWQFIRSYRSDVSYDGPLGHNWDHNYNRRLWLVSQQTLADVRLTFPDAQNGDAILLDGRNRSDIYVRNPDGSFASPPGYFTLLTDNQDGSMTERFSDGTVITYETLFPNHVVRMTSIADRNDNRMTFDYHNGQYLTQVVDTMGRSIDYVYSEGHLSQVRDFTGRSINFEYDNRGNLFSEASPTVTSTPNGNDFPDGKTERYAYSDGFGDPSLNHDLLTITAPSEVANGGPPRVHYQYDTDIASPNVGRVVAKTVGGINASDVPAGGIITFDFSTIPALPAPDDFATPVRQTTVTDRNGNVTEYLFNQRNNVLGVREFTNRDVRPGDPPFFETRYEYDGDYQTTRAIYPAGNEIQYVYDSLNADRFQQGNLLATTELPDANRGGDQAQLVTTYTYEPIYNRLASITEPRGNDVDYVPQNGGVGSAARYTTSYTYDYQEGSDLAPLAAELRISQAEVQQRLDDAGVGMGLGDVNGDGLATQINGNLIRVKLQTVTLQPYSNQAAVDGDTSQEIFQQFAHNDHGQLVFQTDPEGNVDQWFYRSESDPDGDGTPTPEPPDGRTLDGATGGYLRETIRDTASEPGRNSGTNPRPANIRSQYAYDPVGNVIRTVNGRGIATDYVVNELNQVVEVTHAAAHNVFAADPPEPLPLVNFQYVDRFFYDFNDNLVLRQTEDRGNTSNVDGNPPPADLPATAVNPDPVGGAAFVDTIYKYDMLDNLIETIDEVANGTAAEFLHTQFRYDGNENQVLTILPEGNATSTVYDERDLVFQRTAGAFSPPAGSLLGPDDPTDYDVRGGLPSTGTLHYDGNRNLIESVDADDSDLSLDNNSDREGTGDRTRFLYDGFDRLTSTVDSVGNQTVHQYDPAGNLVRTSRFGPVGGPSPAGDGPDILPGPVSVGGLIQAGNLVNSNLLEATEYLYDELGRAFQTDRLLFVNTIPTVRAPDVADGATDLGKGDLTPGDNQPLPGLGAIFGGGVTVQGRVSTQTEYDRNSRRTFAVEDDQDTTRTFYDGMNRVLQTVDPEGNTIAYAYDANNNVIETIETDVAQVAGVAEEVFLTTHFYDSLDRLQQRTDNLGQTMTYRYDSRNNLVATADAQGPLTGATINRRAFPDGPLTVNAMNDFGNVTRYFYDGASRQTLQERVLTADGQGDGVNPGADVFGAKTATPTPDVTQGGGDGIIRVGYTHDDNSLRSALVDDNANVTLYLYDNLNRRVTETKGATVATAPLNAALILGARTIVTPTGATIDDPAVIDPVLIDAQLAAAEARLAAIAPLFVPPLADRIDDNPPTTIVYGYDPDGNVLVREDENDSEIFTRYDAVNRPIAKRIFRAGQADSFLGDSTFAPNPVTDPSNPSTVTTVVGTTIQNYEYDGLSRMVAATDNNDPSDTNDDSIVTYAYDSLNRVIEETQQIGPLPPKAVSFGWRAEDLRSSLTYPNDRVVEYTYDDLDRVNTVGDAGAALPITDYDYIGASRVLVRAYPENGTRMTYLDDAGTTDIGYDGLRRPIELRHLRDDNSLIVGFTHTYDRMNNKLSENKLHDPVNDEVYRYDSAYRLVEFTRPNPLAIPPINSQWDLDGVGNWDTVDGVDRTHSSLNELLTQDGTTFDYDDNGNQTEDPFLGLDLVYDAWNRVVTADRGGQTVAAYAYDAAGRRIQKSVTAGTSLDGVTQYFYDGWNAIEERNVADAVTAQYIFRPGSNEALTVTNFVVGGGDVFGNGEAESPTGTRSFFHQNTLGSVFAITNDAALIVEGYIHDIYGIVGVYNPGADGDVDFNHFLDIFTRIGGSQIHRELGLGGAFFDLETGLYYLGHRFYDMFQGRFLSRDPIGVWGDVHNVGNGFAFVGNNAPNYIDPTGCNTFVFPHLLEWSGTIPDTQNTSDAGIFATYFADGNNAPNYIDPTGCNTFVYPHLLEWSGTIPDTQNTFDAGMFATYFADQAGVSGDATTAPVDINIFIFDETTELPITAEGTANICAPCTFSMGSDGLSNSFDPTVGDNDTAISPRKRKLSVDQMISGDNAGNSFAQGIAVGYIIAVVEDEGINITSAVVNARTGPADLAVFVFEPQPIAAVAS